MNEFKNKLKVEIRNMKDIPVSNYTREKSYIEKIADAVYMAILDVKPENEEEKMKQTELLHNVNKFIYEYENDEEFRKILADYSYAKKYRIIQPKESEER